MSLVLNESPGQRATWRELREHVTTQLPLLSAPAPGLPGLCAVCHGPVGRGSVCCFQCDLHRQCAPGSLADLVVPVAFAIKGGPHATNLWRYKSARRTCLGTLPAPVTPALPSAFPPALTPAATFALTPAKLLVALLLVFLRDHGPCVWRAAGMAAPSHVAVVPSARNRPGVHPLLALISPYLAGPRIELSARPGDHPVRDLDPGRFSAQPVPGASVLLLDDTWTTGSTGQSAAMALRQAGAVSIAIVVLGRHVSAVGAGSPVARRRDVGPAAMPFRPESCAVHDDSSA